MDNFFTRLPKEKQTIALATGVAVLTAVLGFVAGRQSAQVSKPVDKPDMSLSEAFEPDEKPQAPPAPLTPASNITKETNALTDVTKYTLQIPSAVPGTNSIGMSEDAHIIVRCEGGEKDLFISTPEFLSSDSQSVGIRWNDGSVNSEYWGGASGGSALFSGAPMTFLQRLANNDKVVIGYKPWQETASNAVFELSQHRADLEKMIKNCNVG